MELKQTTLHLLYLLTNWKRNKVSGARTKRQEDQEAFSKVSQEQHHPAPTVLGMEATQMWQRTKMKMMKKTRMMQVEVVMERSSSSYNLMERNPLRKQILKGADVVKNWRGLWLTQLTRGSRHFISWLVWHFMLTFGFLVGYWETIGFKMDWSRKTSWIMTKYIHSLLAFKFSI